MRPGQNKRMRGRNNNNNNQNRKGPNPLTRSYESNGPDVKIRGTAHHIAEKYLQLARDAQTSGDPVAAESYLQHAEHYFRLIASAQQAQMGYNRPADEPDPEETDEDDVNAVPDRFASPVERPQPQPQFNPPQPQAERPFNGERQGGYNGERQPYNNGERYDRQERSPQERGPQDRNFQDRNPQDRNPQDRNGQERSGYEGGRRHDRSGRGQRPYRDQEGRQDFRNQEYQGERQAPEHREGGRSDQGGRSFNGQYRDRPRYPADERQSEAMSPQPEAVPREPQPAPVEAPGLPAFITAPVRLGPSTETSAPEAAPEAVPGELGGDAPEFAPRRRRRPRLAAPEPDEAIAPEAPIPNE